jgi:toxin ParE1/3/4
MNKGVWRVRTRANQDIDQIAARIAADNLDAAIRFLDAVPESLDLLAMFPGAGKTQGARSSRLAQLRSWPMGGAFRNYLIFYIQREGGIEVLRVLHGAQELARILEGEEF